MVRREKSTICAVLMILSAFIYTGCTVLYFIILKKAFGEQYSRDISLDGIVSVVVSILILLILAVYYMNIRRDILLRIYLLITVLGSVIGVGRSVFSTINTYKTVGDSLGASVVVSFAINLFPTLLMLVVYLVLLVDDIRKHTILQAAGIVVVTGLLLCLARLVIYIYVLLENDLVTSGGLESAIQSASYLQMIGSTITGGIRMACFCWLYFGMLTDDAGKVIRIEENEE